MYYKLNEAYRLAGWKELPTGVLDTVHNEVTFLERDQYGLLLHMNGQEEIDTAALPPEQQEMIRRFSERGLLRESTERFPESEGELYRYHDHAYIGRVQWSITGGCNFRCRHCLLGTPKDRTGDLSTGQCLDIIRQIASCGIRKVALTGGEPLIRKDLPELIDAFSEAGIQITELYTNGALLTPKLLERFTRAGHRPFIHISYDGVGWHDWVRGHDGAELIAEEALLQAHAAGLKTGAAMALFRDNIPAIRETVRRLALLHVDRIKISPMMPLGLWAEDHAEKTLSDEAFLDAVLGYIPLFFEDGKPVSLKMGGFFDYARETDISTSSAVKNPESPAPLYPCMSMAYNLYIGSDGRVLPCMGFAGREDCGDFPNLVQMPLKEILADSLLLRTSRTKQAEIYARNAACTACPERGRHCGQTCRACAEPDTGGIDRTVCFFVKNGHFHQVRKAVERAGGRYVLR